MNKTEFLFELGRCLAGLPHDDCIEKLSFYSEIIDDKIEDGISEENAVAALGSPRAIADEIIKEYPFSKLVKEKMKPRGKLEAWKIALIAIGSPIWIALGVVLLSAIIVLFAVSWSLVGVVWAIFGTFTCTSVGLVISGTASFFAMGFATGFLNISLSLLLAGVAIFMFFVAVKATEGMAWLTKKSALGIKRLFIGKGEAK